MEVGPHIAVVDDHQEIRQLLVKYLGQHGFTVSAAASAAEFRAQLERGETPDLVVLDIMMPGEDGLSLCRHLRATTGLPVIFLTAMRGKKRLFPENEREMTAGRTIWKVTETVTSAESYDLSSPRNPPGRCTAATASPIRASRIPGG